MLKRHKMRQQNCWLVWQMITCNSRLTKRYTSSLSPEIRRRFTPVHQLIFSWCKLIFRKIAYYCSTTKSIRYLDWYFHTMTLEFLLRLTSDPCSYCSSTSLLLPARNATNASKDIEDLKDVKALRDVKALKDVELFLHCFSWVDNWDSLLSSWSFFWSESQWSKHSF